MAMYEVNLYVDDMFVKTYRVNAHDSFEAERLIRDDYARIEFDVEAFDE